MMSGSIGALLKRYLIPLTRDFSSILEFVYWPVISLVMWGMASIWVTRTTADVSTNFVVVMLTSLSLLQIMYHAQQNISVTFTKELWDKNVVNLFSSPVSLSSWAGATMILGIIKGLIVLGICQLTSLALFGVSIFHHGLVLVSAMIGLLLTGWALGFFITGVLILAGHRMITINWLLPTIISSIVGVYFPVTIFPTWLQQIVAGIPATYAFSAVRKAFLEGARLTSLTSLTSVTGELFLSIVLGFISLCLSLVFFFVVFKVKKRQGLALLEYE